MLVKKNSVHDAQNELTQMSICIWGDGPGRPYDNIYVFSKKTVNEENNSITLFFKDKEECVIENPQGVIWQGRHVKVKTADKITWKHYYYGKPETDDTLIITEYSSIDDSNVHVVVKNKYFQRNEVINVSGKMAVDCI